MTADRARRAIELYEAVLSIDPEERSAYLDGACDGDAALRREVEALLASEPPSTFPGAPQFAERGESAILEDEPPVLEPGNRIGDFEIERPLGAGGMGEVYRARDTRLRRTVAIKILSARLRASAAWRDRFLREAQAISALNHPSICTLHDIGEHDGIDYLVMEYLDGETLADRLRKKALPVEEALECADHVCSALAAAHSAGILHRDLKPGNIMLTDAGAKVLDFGLAKSFRAAGGSSAATTARRSSAGSETTPGIVLGTAAYMSPEQARGEALNRQTDIWSFGCVLYEMLSRRRAFGGRTHSDCIAACLEREPDWAALPASTPAGIRVLLDRCLRKERDFRLHDIGDARIEIREAVDPSAAPVALAAAGDGRFARRHVILLSCAVALLAAIVSGLGVWGLIRSPSRPVSGPLRKLTVQLPDSEPLARVRSLPLSVGRPSIALSPDGLQLVYAAEQEDTTRLIARALDDFEGRPIDGTDGAFNPFFSPNGEWVGFFTRDRLHKVSLRGGRPVPLCEALDPVGGAWGEGNRIVFGTDFGNLLMAIAATGGSPKEIGPARVPGRYRWPQFLPGHEAVMFCNVDGRIEILHLDTGQLAPEIKEGGSYGLYVTSGHLVVGRSGDLYAAPFNLERLAMTGPAVPVVEGVRNDRTTGAVHFAVSREGTLAYVPALARVADGEATLVWVNREGVETSEAVPGRRTYGSFSISPGGGELAATVFEISSQIWIYDLEAQRAPTRWTTEGESWGPIWHPDGTRIVFTSRRGERLSLFWKRADGSGGDEDLLPENWSGGELNKPRMFSRSGAILLFDAVHPTTGSDIWLVRPGRGPPEPVLRTSAHEYAPSFSPDESQIAYVASAEVLVCSFPDAGSPRQISTNGGEEPIWSSRGDEIFYRNGDEWMVVAAAGGPPRLLFEGPFLNVPGVSYRYDAEADRFLVVKGRKESFTEIRVILNWLEELERLVPSGRR